MHALLLTLVAVTTVPAPDRPLDLRTVIDRVQKRYEQAKDFRARFAQDYSRVVMGRSTLSAGWVTFKKPGRMRWDYDKPEPRTFVSNGQVLWLYEPADKQAFRQGLKNSQLPAALAFLMGKGKLVDEFDVSFAKDARQGRPGDYRLMLVPKEPQSAYQSILFVVDPREFLVRETVLIDQQGNTNHFVFEHSKVNDNVPESLFQWSPPPGVRVIDTDHMSDQ
ncbi:MAG: outer membrane lipoprotein carrier protein LolA [Polyangia bacterium]|jgi:outer membrane lipoprotein carrier protein